jgi:ribosomal protein L11 methyltransferase
MTRQSSKQWYALAVTIEPTAREATEYALMEAGALGTQTDELVDSTRVTAYFDQVPDREKVRVEIFEALRIYDLPSSAVREMNLSEVADKDWLGEWKKNWQPVVVGRFVIAPPWSEVTESEDQLVIRIEPGMAFGTGTHETTRLCLGAIQKYFYGRSFLDVGTGTGILAIAAAKLSAEARIQACDNDPDAVTIARENASLNNVAERIEFEVGSVNQDPTMSADCVCANLTADAILPLLPSLIGATCGRLILSGILDSQIDTVMDRLRELGVSSNAVLLQDGEWAAIVI